MLRPIPPTALARMGRALKDWGTGPAGGFTAMAMREPHRVGLVDEKGSLTWGDLHRRSNALARALAARGVGEGDSVAIMCRNHRGFVDACVATAKLGADILLLNTAFAGPQLVDVLEREDPQVRDPRRGVHRPAVRGPDRGPDPRLGRLRLPSGGGHRRPRHGVRRLGPRPAGAPRPHRDPHLGHHRRPRRAPRGARPVSAPRCRSCRGCPCATAGGPTSPHRCSTPGASPTWRSRCCWGRPSSCAGGSTARAAWRRSRTSDATRWW